MVTNVAYYLFLFFEVTLTLYRLQRCGFVTGNDVFLHLHCESLVSSVTVRGIEEQKQEELL